MSYPKPYTPEDLNRYEVIPTEFRSYISGQRLIATVEALERVTRERDEQLEDSERIIAALVKERDEARASEKDTWANWESRVAALKEQIQEAKADAARLREALTGLKQRQIPDGPCWCFLWSDEEANAESVLSEEGHCDECTRAREALKEEP